MKEINNQKGLNSTWTDSLTRNVHPDGSALVDHLRTVHYEHTGFTEECASCCRDESGRNSYEWLAELVPDNESLSVLDLACGSGPLLKILYDRNKNLNLRGIDMCPEELTLANTRLINSGATLLPVSYTHLTLPTSDLV